MTKKGVLYSTIGAVASIGLAGLFVGVLNEAAGWLLILMIIPVGVGGFALHERIYQREEEERQRRLEVYRDGQNLYNAIYKGWPMPMTKWKPRDTSSNQHGPADYGDALELLKRTYGEDGE